MYKRLLFVALVLLVAAQACGDIASEESAAIEQVAEAEEAEVVVEEESVIAAEDTPTLTPTDPPTPTSTPEPTSIPLGYPGNPVINNDQWAPVVDKFNGIEMALVPAGCFMMGSDSDEAAYDEQPVHEVCFAEPFWIDVYEVTNSQFEAFGGEVGRNSNWTEGDRPRDRITWIESEAFCNLRGARLPTEAEWEYAARGPDSLVYPWGDDFVADNVVYNGNSGLRTWDVGSKTGGVSWVGAYDLSGNVWEWVNSLYMALPYDPDDGREVDSNIDSSNLRMVRGGSWINDASGVRAAFRGAHLPSNENVNFGFRCVLSYQP